MPIPGSEREKRMLQEIAGQKKSQPQFLQEINEPEHPAEKKENLLSQITSAWRELMADKD